MLNRKNSGGDANQYQQRDQPLRLNATLDTTPNQPKIDGLMNTFRGWCSGLDTGIHHALLRMN
jgi:hypothetical protein